MIVEESGILSSEGGGVLMDGPGRRDRRAEVGLSGDLGGTRITHLMYADDMVLLAESSGRLQTDLLKPEEAMGNHGLTINAKKSSVLHMGEDGRIAPPDRALRMGDGSAIPALGDQDITRYLGVSLVGGGTKTDGGLACGKKLDATLANIASSRLTPRQRVRCVRQVAIPRRIHELSLEPGNNATLPGIDKTIHNTLVCWLGPDDAGRGAAPGGSPSFCLDEQIYKRTKKGGLGIMNLAKHIPRIQERKLSKIAKRAAEDPEDPILAVTASSEHWGTQIPALIERE